MSKKNIEQLVQEMPAKDENLRKEFEEKLKDTNFAQNPSARLRFFYKHSPYMEKMSDYIRFEDLPPN